MVNNNNNDGLVHPVPDSTELIIQRAIKGIQKMIIPYECKEGETPQVAVIQINPAMKRHWESEIKILRDAPRDPDKLKEILKAKQKEYEKATDSEDIERLVPEIEMLKFVLFLVLSESQKQPVLLLFHKVIMRENLIS
jgi:hypothetical protein